MDKRWIGIIQAVVDRTKDFPTEAYDDLLSALDTIEEKYGLIVRLTDEERQAIEEGRRSLDRREGVPIESVMESLGIHNFDRNVAGKEDLEEVLLQIQKFSGEDQGRIARILYGLTKE
jgi:hypothetical protein